MRVVGKIESLWRYPVKSMRGEELQEAFVGFPGVYAQLLFDAQQLVVFRHAIGARHRTGLDLRGRARHRNVGDSRVLGLPRAVRNHRGVVRLIGHFDRCQGLGKGADLVGLDQDRVGDATRNALGQDLGVGDEQIVTHELQFAASSAVRCDQPAQSASPMPSSMVMIG